MPVLRKLLLRDVHYCWLVVGWFIPVLAMDPVLAAGNLGRLSDIQPTVLQANTMITEDPIVTECRLAHPIKYRIIVIFVWLTTPQLWKLISYRTILRLDNCRLRRKLARLKVKYDPPSSDR